MTSQSPRIYIYKITFEEVPYYYYGVKKEKYFNQEYWGSPKTNKWCWELYTPKKQILQFFDFTDEGWLKAQEVETRLIRPFYNTDKWCLNESCGGISSLNIRREAAKKSAETNKNLKKGIYARTPEQMIIDGKKGAQKVKENETGIFSLTTEQLSENGKKGGTKTYELGLGLFSLTKEQMIENGKKSGKRAKELGLGIFALTPEQRSENGKKLNSQRCKCTETGYVSTPAGLSNYQRARGIDTSKRVRIS
jgi:general stress protein YciG